MHSTQFFNPLPIDITISPPCHPRRNRPHNVSSRHRRRLSYKHNKLHHGILQLLKDTIAWKGRAHPMDVRVRIHVPPGRLLGGSNTTLTTRSPHIDGVGSEHDLTPLHSEENWWPLYINLASKLQTESAHNSHRRPLLAQDQFQLMPTHQWMHEFQAMGIPFSTASKPIEKILPLASRLWKLYNITSPPHIDISHLSLEEVLCHIRIAHQQIQKLGKSLKSTQKQLNSWYRKKCPRSPAIKTQNIQRLLLQQHNLRISKRLYADFFTKLQKNLNLVLKRSQQH
jgi:hypothetical protein